MHVHPVRPVRGVHVKCDCGRPVLARGLCSREYQAARKSGALEVKRYRRPPEEYFFEKVDTSGPCWDWTADCDRDGYGRFSVGLRHGDLAGTYRAHRWCWEFLCGVQLGELELDHSCRNRKCVNPDHLEVMTKRQHNAKTLSEVHGIGEKLAGLAFDPLEFRKGQDFCA